MSDGAVSTMEFSVSSYEAIWRADLAEDQKKKLADMQRHQEQLKLVQERTQKVIETNKHRRNQSLPALRLPRPSEPDLVEEPVVAEEEEVEEDPLIRRQREKQENWSSALGPNYNYEEQRQMRWLEVARLKNTMDDVQRSFRHVSCSPSPMSASRPQAAQPLLPQRVEVGVSASVGDDGALTPRAKEKKKKSSKRKSYGKKTSTSWFQIALQWCLVLPFHTHTVFQCFSLRFANPPVSSLSTLLFLQAPSLLNLPHQAPLHPSLSLSPCPRRVIQTKIVSSCRYCLLHGLTTFAETAAVAPFSKYSACSWTLWTCITNTQMQHANVGCLDIL